MNKLCLPDRSYGSDFCGGQKNNVLPAFWVPLIIKWTLDRLTGENVQSCPRWTLWMYIQRCHRNIMQLRAYMPFCTRRRGPRFWDFKGKAGNLQVDEKEQLWVTLILSGPPWNGGTQRGVQWTAFASFFPPCCTEFVLWCWGDILLHSAGFSVWIPMGR